MTYSVPAPDRCSVRNRSARTSVIQSRWLSRSASASQSRARSKLKRSTTVTSSIVGAPLDRAVPVPRRSCSRTCADAREGAPRTLSPRRFPGGMYGVTSGEEYRGSRRMFFKQFYLQGLGHASYLVGSEATGDALLFDPQRDVSGYFAAARMQGLRVRHALDSHGHNDYLSGLTEIASRGEVALLASAAAGVGFDHRAVRDGEQFELGEVGFEVMATPGHTPEHISLLVYDRDASADVPAMLLSGGALLVGDLARPDLLGGRDQAEAAAKEFCATIQTKILELPDHVEVFPTHVSGSLCGGNIGSRLSTTVGYERRTNAILATASASPQFVETCLRLDDLPAVPPYWRRMRARNLGGVPRLGVLGEPPALPPAEVQRAVDAG